MPRTRTSRTPAAKRKRAAVPRKRQSRKKQVPPLWKSWRKRAALASLGATAALGLFGLALVLYYASILPRPERLGEVETATATQIYDRTGNVLLYEIRGEEKRVPVSLDQVPLYLRQAVLAAEDESFYRHFGVDVGGIARAIITNVLRGELAQGGSTITQQLARSVFLTRERTLERKVKELVLTFDLELRHSKDDILEAYLNQVPMGSNVYGVGAASEFYFNKPAADLTMKEAAALAAMIRAPSFYSPFKPQNAEALQTRTAGVLERMERLDFISPEEEEQAKQAELKPRELDVQIKAPHFVFEVLDALEETYGAAYLRTNGLRVITALDWELQQAAVQAVDQFQQYNTGFNAHNAALAALNPATGEILAMVGSKNWGGASAPAGCSPGVDCLFDPKVNVATTLQGRQPGSAFKPFVYATAFEQGADEETVVVDEETNFGVWGDEEYVPANYDGKFRGEVTLREALAQSLNVPSVKVLLELAGIADSVETAKDMGITTLRDPSAYGPSLVLGAGEVRLLDMVSAYGAFSQEGRLVPPLSILRVETPEGRALENNRHEGIAVLSPRVARMITSILSDNEARAPVFGRNSMLNIPGVAVKTGTTQEYRDAWTIGYATDGALAAGVWVGNNNNAPMRNAPGLFVAAPIWNAFMTRALAMP